MLSKLFPTPPNYFNGQISAFHKNIRLHLIDGSLYVLGMSLISVQTTLPVFIKELGGSPISIGSVQVLWTLGQYIPSLFIAHYLRKRELFSSAMLSLGLIHRMMLFICGVAVLLLVGNVSSTFAVPIFLFLIFLIPALGSVAGLPWFQVFTKTVPVRLRGRLLGFRQLLGSAGGIIGSSMVGLILSSMIFPINFALLFFLAFFFTMISIYFLSGISEPPAEYREEKVKELNIFSDIRRIVRENRNFRNFLFADMFSIMAISASSFYSVFALEKFSLSSSYAGTFTAIIMITNIGANILFGFIADTFGHKTNLLVFSVCIALTGLFAIISPNILIYGIVFFLLACTITVQSISRLSFIAEMCNEYERPAYIGIINTFAAPSVFIGILFGWLVPRIGYDSIFIVTSLLGVISFLILYQYVQEPRNQHY